MNVEKKKVSLLITSEATTKLSIEQQERERKVMLERIKKEEKRQALRRAKQDKQLAFRAAKKADLRVAKDAENLVELHCNDLEETLKLRGESKNAIEAAEKVVKDAETRAFNALTRHMAAMAKHDEAEEHLLHAHEALHAAKAPTDQSIIDLKISRLQESLTIANENWNKVGKATCKKTRNRSIKAWAKRLLGL